ncbi:hypothetical protein VE00_00842 [Pseudogymnoascus sp. WSF 3629]|nr:hypothetical protein VE00_00842 [Pseudogymnoascus sp. WSF 3629]
MTRAIADCALRTAEPAERLILSEDALLSIQEEEEDARLLAANEEYEVDGRSCVDDDETTLWLKYTKWPVQLANRPLDILSASSLQPTASDDDYVLGDWAGTQFVSPAADEAKLRVLLQATDQMFTRAEETLKQTHHRLRCWLQTYHLRHFRPVPFQPLQTDAGRTRYIATWKRFICYIFRVWATAKPLRQEIYGIRFREQEAALMESVWEGLLNNNDAHQGEPDKAEPNSGSDPRPRLTEALFQVSMTFWTFRSTTGNLAPSVLVHFTSVLGVHRRALAYKSAYSYTPMLSALIWVSRLLFFEYALPLRAYSILYRDG